MADIFISYAHEDRAKVEPLFMALKAHGWSVFWDQCIAGGEIWDAVIEEELKSAKRIVVVWSKNSLTSNWVKAEALEALGKKSKLRIRFSNVSTKKTSFIYMYNVHLYKFIYI